MDYIEVHQTGMMCYADAAIIDNAGYLYLASLFGPHEQVKSIEESLLIGKNLQVNGVSVVRPKISLQTATQDLDDGLTHKVIFAPDFFTNAKTRILAGEDRKTAFELLDAAISTPLKEEWSEFLWETVFTPMRLIGFGQVDGKDLSDVYLVNVDKTIDQVDALIREEIKTGRLH
jgi:hypothetical protein